MNDALVDYGKQIRNVVSAIIGTADVYAEKNHSIKKVIVNPSQADKSVRKTHTLRS